MTRDIAAMRYDPVRKSERHMVEVHAGLWIGDLEDCIAVAAGFAVVHACKFPCHQSAVGYRGSLSSEHPDYFSYEAGNQLYLNLVDPPVPLFKPGSFQTALRFLRENLPHRPTLVHCNLGLSRAPSIALLYLAKVAGELDAGSYESAAREFSAMYPVYQPGSGIRIFLDKEWENLG